MNYYLILDDSGKLHSNCNHGNVFCFGGLLMNEDNYHNINQAYKKYIKQIKKEKSIANNIEFKTTNMSFKTRRRLLKVLSDYDSVQVFVCAKIKCLKRLDFNNSKDVVRYQNYMIYRLIEKLVKNEVLPNDCTKLYLKIDNQSVAHSSIDSLEDYLFHMFNDSSYYYAHDKRYIPDFECDFDVKYRDSKYDYLVQAADLLANTKHNSFNFDKKNDCSLAYTRKFLKKDYISLRLPDGINY
ncbi:DUF3800 domain-containing protein [Vagococcus vulneris]|uniref:DUF3800 domain-containing protein n=1 Tax=Vagococcus vulneris TaxID=1977869 RepID=A0A429ZQU7_9ENTE|nr:DUF3800 domain-containing protein [Vagococcus vulneris]RST96019.1 hypothetical protein CBF37_11280 [Vagococcus vulneris]